MTGVAGMRRGSSAQVCGRELGGQGLPRKALLALFGGALHTGTVASCAEAGSRRSFSGAAAGPVLALKQAPQPQPPIGGLLSEGQGRPGQLRTTQGRACIPKAFQSWVQMNKIGCRSGAAGAGQIKYILSSSRRGGGTKMIWVLRSLEEGVPAGGIGVVSKCPTQVASRSYPGGIQVALQVGVQVVPRWHPGGTPGGTQVVPRWVSR